MLLIRFHSRSSCNERKKKIKLNLKKYVGHKIVRFKQFSPHLFTNEMKINVPTHLVIILVFR